MPLYPEFLDVHFPPLSINYVVPPSLSGLAPCKPGQGFPADHLNCPTKTYCQASTTALASGKLDVRHAQSGLVRDSINALQPISAGLSFIMGKRQALPGTGVAIPESLLTGQL